jgi:hypothetical protein
MKIVMAQQARELVKRILALSSRPTRPETRTELVLQLGELCVQYFTMDDPLEHRPQGPGIAHELGQPGAVYWWTHDNTERGAAARDAYEWGLLEARRAALFRLQDSAREARALIERGREETDEEALLRAKRRVVALEASQKEKESK